MKVLYLLLCLGYVYCFGRGELEKYGPFQVILRSTFIKCEHSKTFGLDVSGMSVYFYDLSKNYVAIHNIKNATKSILQVPGFDSKRKFIIFVPGYNTDMNKETVDKVKNAFKTYPNSYLIILDHSKYTNGKGGLINSYERSVTHVYYIGKAVAEMLYGLQQGRVSPKNMHCIGHSLGSQILGHTGEIFMNITGNKISKITALDPAGPCFSNSFIQEQVRSGVAEYVEVYHCNAGGLGTSSVLGDTDFFANRNGAFQPNCGTPLFPDMIASTKSAICSHSACVDLYLATVNHPEWFLAQKCDKYEAFKKGECAKNNVTKAGFWNPGTARGVYYFSTKGLKID